MKYKLQNYSHQAYSMLFMSGVFWGFAALFYKKSLAVVSITVFLAIRFVMGASFIFATERKKFIRLSSKVFGLIALFTVVDTIMINFLYSAGIQRTTALNAAIIHLSTPFIVYFLATFFYPKNHTVESLSVL